jgi:AcrR family transcriptional regulator
MEDNVLHRKERLILSTIDIIEELGIQGLTTREIAKRQGVSEATIFRHYRNKNELLLAVLDYYIQYDADIKQSTQLNGLKPLEAIRFLITTYAVYYENYPAITAITQIYDVLRYDAELADKIREIQQNRTIVLSQIINKAQKAGEIPDEADCEIIAEMITGFFREICFNWRLKNYQFSLKERIEKALDILLDALQTNIA